MKCALLLLALGCLWLPACEVRLFQTKHLAVYGSVRVERFSEETEAYEEDLIDPILFGKQGAFMSMSPEEAWETVNYRTAITPRKPWRRGGKGRGNR